MVFCLVLSGFGCGGRMPEGLGFREGRLAPCPDKPNCVSSFAKDDEHRIAALAIEGPAASAWQGLKGLVEGTPRVEPVTTTDDYLHVVYTSALMRYRDDVEFLLLADENVITVRSASRVGYGDMGVNRNRIEAIRKALSERGLVSASSSD